MSVRDVCAGERRLDIAEIELRVGAGARNSADIGEHLNIRGLQQRNQVIDAAGGVADCVKQCLLVRSAPMSPRCARSTPLNGGGKLLFPAVKYSPCNCVEFGEEGGITFFGRSDNGGVQHMFDAEW